MNKTCNKCGESKPLEEFYKQKTCKYGVRSHCKFCMNNSTMLYNEKNRETINRKQLENRNKNIEHCKARDKEYRAKNADRIRELNRNGQRKYKTTVKGKLMTNLNDRMYKSLTNQNVKRTISTLEALGCTYEELKVHIESQFTEGMTWENHGKWHLDHHIPCAAFDLSKEDNQRKCFGFKNVRPLWANDNWRKGYELPLHLAKSC